jgi:hypothetical protein
VWMVVMSLPIIPDMFTFCQNCIPKAHPLIMCSGVSSSAWQISQVASCSTWFRCSIVRHWILR